MRPSATDNACAPPLVTQDDRDAFVLAQTTLAAPALVPDITLHLAREPFAIWQATTAATGQQPYWAFAWPGGQALARYVLDHPTLVAGRRVLDLGSGSGVAGIAAMRAGAASCV